MADVEKQTTEKGLFSWFHCVGGCNRKLQLKKEDKGNKIKPKIASCFDGLWSCIRCLLKTKYGQHQSYEEREAAQPTHVSDGEDDLELLDLIFKAQSRRMEDQRCVLKQSVAVSPASAKLSNDLQQDSGRPPGSQTVKEQSSGGSEMMPLVPKLLDPRDIQLDQLQYVATLGKGGYGHVELVTLKTEQSKSFALKSIRKSHIVRDMKQRFVHSEKNIMTAVDSAFIVRMYWAHTDRKYIYMLLELCLGGDLERLLSKWRYFNNDMARFYIACLVLALQYLHNRGIVHRDLKPANLLIDSKGFLKLGDFGLAWKLGSGEKSYANCGTVFYKAPEVISREGHDIRADYWSLGVIVFELLSGRKPFLGFTRKQVQENILKGINRILFSQKIGKNAQKLINSLCRRNPNQRLGSHGIRDIKHHEWFENFPWKSLNSKNINPPVVPKVKGPTDCQNFKTRRRRKRVPSDVSSGWDLDF